MSETIYQPRKPAETFEGKPCKKCGGTLRYSCNQCVSCKKIYAQTLDRKMYWKAYRQTSKRKTSQKVYVQMPDRKMYQQAIQRKYKYGVTQEEYDNMISTQNNCCAICLRTFETTPHVDHSHQTEKIRGLLCRPCNIAIGLFKDNPEICRQAATYLES